MNSLNQRIDSLERALRAPGPVALPLTPPGPCSANTSTPASIDSRHGNVEDHPKVESSSIAEGRTVPAMGTQQKAMSVFCVPITDSDYIGWLGQELQALRNFSIGHLHDHGHLEADSPVMQALTELDGALTDMGTMHDPQYEERLKALLPREEARKAVQGTSHTTPG